MEPAMTRNEIRIELLGQHANLRTLIEAARKAASLWRTGQVASKELHERLRLLAETSHAHSEREELLLRGVIPTVDAWGAVRADIMDEEHLLEHRELSAALSRADTLVDPVGAASAVLLCLDQMLGHMEREEKAFLNEKVLNDDFMPADAFGG